MSESETITKEKILEKLREVDQKYNQFQFSKCRDRHIVIVGSKSSNKNLLGQTIRREQYVKPDLPRKTKTFLMVPDDPTCNICIINLIELKPIEFYEPMPEKKTNIRPSPMTNIDQAIFDHATKIDLIVFICDAEDENLINKMFKWAREDVERQAIMALVLLHRSSKNPTEESNDLKSVFPKGILHIYLNDCGNETKQDWREQFFRMCVGEETDRSYKITHPTSTQVENSRCLLF